MRERNWETAECGTYKKYQWHLRQRKKDPSHVIDQDCKDGAAQYHKDWRHGRTEEAKNRDKRTEQARRMATEKLVMNHLKEYRILFAEAKKELGSS